MSTRHIGKCNSKFLLAPNFGKGEMGLLHCFEIWDGTRGRLTWQFAEVIGSMLREIS
jgi:hypothetical protein